MIADTIDITLPNYGTIRGSVDTDRQIAIFFNVPYGHVPERWRVAVKPQPWTGVRDATVQGPACPQGPTQSVLAPLVKLVPEGCRQVGNNPKYEFGVEQSERDGLNMNIYVPLSVLVKGVEPIPVMTWVHGGGFRDGANCVPLYDARNFVQHSIQLSQPVIVVAINYRLATFGFLASKELQEDMDEYVRNSPTPVSLYDQSVGNWGLQDQKLAFEWVRENISVYGGDSRNVTAWGESAGSFSLHYHMLIPAHHGLFDHAILQSGVVGTMPAGTIEQDGQAIFDKLLETLKIPADLDAVEKVKRMRAVPMDELTQATETAFSVMAYGPFHDGGKFMPSTMPIQTWSTHISSYDLNLKSIMIGSTRDEGSFALFLGEAKLSAYPGFVQMFVPDPELVPLFESAYGIPKSDEEVAKLLTAFVGDMQFQYPIAQTIDTLLELKKARGDDFQFVQYHYDVELSKMREMAPGMGAMHAGELPVIFGPPFSEQVFTRSEMALSKEMQKRWIGFANQKPVVDESGNFANPEKDEAIIWTYDHRVEVGKGRRLSKEAIVFWDTMAKPKLQKIQQGLSSRE
ncbi:hypothetical protein BGX29_004980 [Mortierella sp. GBA35]|nr:hypothetical protein BGX29_004980 [Mortierella sp. GBA35]